MEVTDEEWGRHIKVNLTGTFYCSQFAAREMIKQNQGKIINIASVAGETPIKYETAYSVSKAGVIMLTRCMARELANYKINVNCITLGGILTPMTEKAYNEPETAEKILKVIPIHEVGKPKDVAKAVLFLASEDSDYITGAVLRIDGGWIQSLPWLPFD